MTLTDDEYVAQAEAALAHWRARHAAYYTDFGHFERESEAVLDSAAVLVAISSFPCTRELMMRAWGV